MYEKYPNVFFSSCEVWDRMQPLFDLEGFDGFAGRFFSYIFREEEVALASIGNKLVYVLAKSGNLYMMSKQ